MHKQTKRNEQEHNTITTEYRGHEITWCADCGYFSAHEHIHLISDTFDGCKQLVDMSETKLAHISKNNAVPQIGFARWIDGANESENTTT